MHQRASTMGTGSRESSAYHFADKVLDQLEAAASDLQLARHLSRGDDYYAALAQRALTEAITCALRFKKEESND